MEVVCDKRDGTLIAAIGGPVDHESADDFEAKMTPVVHRAASLGARLVLDFRDLDYMSSVGLRVLLRVANEARARSVDFSVADLNDTMREIFQVSRFDKILRVFDSVDAALSS